MKNHSQLHIDFENPDLEWPNQEDFPINEGKRKIRDILLKDISSSKEYLIITGFTSLANTVEIFGKEPLNLDRKTRILLGFEPEVRRRKTWTKTPLTQEIKEYWINKGIDVLQGGMVIQTIEHIKNGNIEFKIKERLHAKLYVGDSHAVLGSANFSKQGIISQQEATIRVKSRVDEESCQYTQIKRIAENFWLKGTSYDMQSLLEELLQKVPWNQALARAIAEILEGNWISSYPQFQQKIESAKLWPYQVTGLAKSLILLDQQGSVLVADPTGSGKTRMITICILSLIHNLWETGKRDRTNTLILCPKPIVENWEKECLELSFLNNSAISIGILQREGRNRNRAIKALQAANILALDEAHNFLSKKTNRSNAFDEHSADFIILSTATPINKKAEDLLRLIELLGPDNLKDDELEKLKELYRKPIQESKINDLKKLNNFIQRFILRRTKKQLNNLIDREPDTYTNKFGDRARFPEVINDTYTTDESPEDIEIANKIIEKAQKLKGLIYLRKFKIPVYVDKDNTDQIKGYYKRRLNAAKAFTEYHIRNSMRSSRIALVEHISGTINAKKWLNLKTSKSETGNIIERLESFLGSPLPKSGYPEFLPKWLTEVESYKSEIQREIKIYEQILELIKKMSDRRERGKAKKIIQLVNEHKMVLAFDSTVLTLYHLREILKEEGYSKKIYLVSGTSEASRIEVQDVFGVDSKAESGLALCSDVMSEGVNLQRAKALIQLDMPSVLRLAEQRVGRLHRMDSPHDEIQAYWSKDSNAFALKADRRLIKTTILTDKLIGGNLELPEEFLELEEELWTAENMIKEFKPFVEEEKKWEGLHDAFEPIYKLKEGPDAIIKEEVYEELRKTKASIKCRVSFVGSSTSSWAFICTQGTEKKSPMWLYIEDSGAIYNEFPAICNLLRENLSSVEDIDWHQDTLSRFLELYRKNERKAIPHKKRRALEVAEFLLDKQTRAEVEKEEDIALINRLLDVFKVGYREDDMAVDYDRFADMWLDLLKPLLKKKQQKSGRRELITLENLKTKWVVRYFEPEQLRKIYDHIPLMDKLENRIAACVIGVGAS
ncbi:MAG: SNF2-related protein [Allomuricauda sp.]